MLRVGAREADGALYEDEQPIADNALGVDDAKLWQQELVARDDLREAFRVRLPLRPSSGNRCLKLPDFRNWGVRCCVD